MKRRAFLVAGGAVVFGVAGCQLLLDMTPQGERVVFVPVAAARRHLQQRKPIE